MGVANEQNMNTEIVGIRSLVNTRRMTALSMLIGENENPEEIFRIVTELLVAEFKSGNWEAIMKAKKPDTASRRFVDYEGYLGVWMQVNEITLLPQNEKTGRAVELLSRLTLIFCGFSAAGKEGLAADILTEVVIYCLDLIRLDHLVGGEKKVELWHSLIYACRDCNTAAKRGMELGIRNWEIGPVVWGLTNIIDPKIQMADSAIRSAQDNMARCLWRAATLDKDQCATKFVVMMSQLRHMLVFNGETLHIHASGKTLGPTNRALSSACATACEKIAEFSHGLQCVLRSLSPSGIRSKWFEFLDIEYSLEERRIHRIVFNSHTGHADLGEMTVDMRTAHFRAEGQILTEAMQTKVAQYCKHIVGKPEVVIKMTYGPEFFARPHSDPVKMEHVFSA